MYPNFRSQLFQIFGVGSYKFPVVAFSCIYEGAKFSIKLTSGSYPQTYYFNPCNLCGHWQWRSSNRETDSAVWHVHKIIMCPVLVTKILPVREDVFLLWEILLGYLPCGSLGSVTLKVTSQFIHVRLNSLSSLFCFCLKISIFFVKT